MSGKIPRRAVAALLKALFGSSSSGPPPLKRALSQTVVIGLGNGFKIAGHINCLEPVPILIARYSQSLRVQHPHTVYNEPEPSNPLRSH